ncbi:MAG: hypothetical protein NTX57_05785 [Armatimonadetes bacterium]|nr:hypothetical protein [Armatimonadota bacterium]
MSFPNGPIMALAPSIMRFLQFAQRKKMASRPEPHLPGEPPMSQQIAGANSLAIDPSFLPETKLPQRPLPPVPPPQGGMPMPDDMGRAPSPRIAMMAGQAPMAAAEQAPSFPRPEPLDLPERTYDMPPVVTPPSLAPPPTRDIAKENNRAMQSALIPAGLGLLLGGAPAAAAGGAAAFAGNKARSEQEAAVANQEYGIKRSNDMAQYGMNRQETGDKANRITQQMRQDQSRDILMTQAKRSEWEAWNKEQDRLAKARTLEGGDTTKTVNALLTHRAKTAELMASEPEGPQRRVAGDFNRITASLGHPELAITIPQTGPVFELRPQDLNRNALAGLANARTAQVPVLAGNAVAKTQAEIGNIAADNKREDGKAQFDQWYKTIQAQIALGKFNAVELKAQTGKELGSVKTWEDAQPKIAEYMGKAAAIRRGRIDPDTGVGIVPPSPQEMAVAFNYEDAADALGVKFGRVREGGRWVAAKPPSTASAPSVSQYSIPAKA